MAKIDANLMSLAKQIAYELNKKDGSTTDNKIMAKYWTPFALPKGAKDNVTEFININQAEISIYSYLRKNAAKSNEAPTDIGEKWLNDLLNVPDEKMDDSKIDNKKLSKKTGNDIDNQKQNKDTKTTAKNNEVKNNNEINYKNLIGIDRVIAEKANVNGGNTLDIVEMKLFTEIKSTYNSKNETFVFNGILYDKNGNYFITPQLIEKPLSTFVYKTLSQEEMKDRTRSAVTLEKINTLVKNADEAKNKTITVKKEINGKTVEFSYNQASIEDYIINDAVDKKGNKNTHFADIPDIRKKTYAMRTEKENKKLLEFDNMVNSAISAGVEYGLDPKLIIATMQIEVDFAGLREDVTGVNGKGYMQITSNPIRDMLGYNPDTKGYNKNLKTNVYGKEFVELMESRGFDINCSPEKRGIVANNIVKYLKENKDTDFNIRLGAIIYRRNYNGDVRKASEKYNGHPNLAFRQNYGNRAAIYYSRLVAKEEGTQRS